MWSIDVDFQDDRREEVIEYVREKYGEECVSYIITYGQMKAKSAIRDVARILDYEASFGDKISKLVPDKAKSLKHALNESVELGDLYDSDKHVRKVVDTAMKIEGLPKSTGKHACFSYDTLITTDKGKKQIIDVRVGDMVLTHNNRYKPVMELYRTPTEEYYKLELENNQLVEVTGNHPLYVKDPKFKVPVWKKVDSINIEKDRIGILKTNSNIEWIEITSIKEFKGFNEMFNLSILDDNSYVANDIVAHNCGIIIAPDEVTNFIPQVIVSDETGEKNEKGEKLYEQVMVTQINMVECEEMGLLKMDFLGLRNLSVISGALKLINKKREKEGLKPLKMDDIPITDPYAYKHIQAGNTLGVFQLESAGMTDLVSKTYLDIEEYVKKYDENPIVDENGIGVYSEEFDALFERLIALISLYRPGPMDEIPNYLRNMANPDSIEYDIPEMEELLSNTYGIIVYQEQVMHTVRKLAGFSPGESDVIRKAMGKKYQAIVDEYGEYFLYGSEEIDKQLIAEKKPPKGIKGCVANGISEEKAKVIWDKMYKFAKYAFNKSHATGYAVISIRTAWLSYHYPVEFMTALLNSNINKNDKLEHYVAKIKSLGFDLLGPDVNESEELFSIAKNNNAIRFGLRGIKGLGASSLLVIGARGKEKFTTITDFVNRLNKYLKCDRKVLECIAQCGGFESIEPNRRAIVESADIIVDSLKKDKKKNVAGQISLFECFSDEEEIAEIGSITLKDVEDYSLDEKLALEKEKLSFYVSGHPLDKYDEIISNSEKVVMISDIKMALGGDDDYETDELGFVDTQSLEEVLIMGQIVSEKTIQTKKNDLMARIEVEDKTGTISCVLFPRQREAYRARIQNGSIVAITGKAEKNDFGTQIIVADVSSPQVLSNNETPHTLRFISPFAGTGEERKYSVALYKKYKEMVESYNNNGDVQAIFVVDGKEITVGSIPSSVATTMQFKKAFGEDKLRFEY